MKPSLRIRRVILRLLPAFAVLGLFLLPALSGNAEPSPEPSAAPNKYIGAKKCQNCHDAEASGNQWGAWMESGHSNALKVLSADEAKKVAAERGIADASKSDECLRCHVTAFGEPQSHFKKSFDREDGVGCESCHGPGNNHARARFRAANEEDDEDEGFGDEEEEASYTEIPDGEIGNAVTRETCIKCHNKESPTYKPFCFHLRVKKMGHINPLKPRTAEELAAMLVCSCGETCDCDFECKDTCGVPPSK